MPDAYLMLALAEGFAESLVPALLQPELDPSRCLEDPPEPPAVPRRVAARLRQPDLAQQAHRIRGLAAMHGLDVLTPDHPHWPTRLREAPLRPLVLFARGATAALVAPAPAVAVVGSRTPTPYGIDAALQTASSMVRSGVILWSGLARGIDALAHTTSVDAGAPTVAVVAGGLDVIYPPEHGTLASRIITSGGCLISELPPGRRARRGHFPRRNRLLALSTQAVVVVEASLLSGALHTARFAAEYGTDVFAIPGPWGSERSQGCHRLIAEGAGIVEGPEALLRALGIHSSHSGSEALRITCSADEQAILQGLVHGPRPSDLLQRESGLDRATFLRALFALEQRGIVQRLPGGLFRATPAAVTSR